MFRLKILVTGGAGFLGSNLVVKLISAGHDVLVVDNLLTGNLSNLEDLIGSPRLTIHKSNVIDFVENLEENIQQIYHLASPASPPKYMQFPYETMMANTIATDKLCKYALKNNSRILFSSTSEIYGDPLIHPQPESYWGNVNTLGVRSVYDESKRFGETIISHYNRTQSLNCVIVRIFNTYGPKMDPFDGRVVSNFIRQTLEKSPITMYGDGLQTRSFCYVDDLIDGLIRAMNAKEFGPINLGNPKEYTLIELSNLIAELIGTKQNLIFKEIPEDDPRMRKPVISKAKEYLSWEPTTELVDGLKPTIEWIKSRIK